MITRHQVFSELHVEASIAHPESRCDVVLGGLALWRAWSRYPEGAPCSKEPTEEDLRNLLLVMFFCEINTIPSSEGADDEEEWYPTLATQVQLDLVVWYLTQIKAENTIESLDQAITDAMGVWSEARDRESTRHS